MLGEGLYRAPAWELLLYLLIRCEDGKTTSVSRLCSASRLPIGTAMRCIATLISGGKLSADGDFRSDTGTLLELTPGTADQLRYLLTTWLED